MRLSILALLLLSCSAVADSTAFVNVNVISMEDDSVSAAQTVIVEEGRIVTVGPVQTTPVPKDSRTVDGTDRYLVPGLAEMHAHLASANSGSLERTIDLFVANGVTTMRGMLGHPSHLKLRDDIARHDVIAPRLVTSGPSLNGNSVSGAADAREKVRRQQAAGYDFLKLHTGLSRSEFDAIAREAATLGIPYAGHVSVSVGLNDALAAPMATIDHLDGYMAAMLPASDDGAGGFGGFFGVLLADAVDTSLIHELANLTADSGVANVPTQSLFEGVVSKVPPEDLARRPEMAYVPASTVDNWVRSKSQLQAEDWDQGVADRAIAIRRELLRALHDAGATLLLGSDAPQVFNVPGFSIHRELEILVEAGFSPYQALSMGTSAVGDFLGLRIGRVAVGYEADLLLVDDNPLESIGYLRRLHGVMLRGHWVPAEERARLLAKHRRAL